MAAVHPVVLGLGEGGGFAATAESDYRYVLAATPFGWLAADMAFSPGTAGGRLVRKLAARARKQEAPVPPR